MTTEKRETHTGDLGISKLNINFSILRVYYIFTETYVLGFQN